MKKALKRLIALILTITMCLSLLSANVWATEKSSAEDGTVSAQSSEEASGQEEAIVASSQSSEEVSTEDNSAHEEGLSAENESDDNEEDTTQNAEPIAITEDVAEAEPEDTGDAEAEVEGDDESYEEKNPLENYPETSENDDIASGTIIGFNRISDSCITLSRHISLSKLMKKMPETITVKLMGEKHSISIPVNWFSEIDYDTTHEHYYLFWAEWDNTKYPLDPKYNIEDYKPFIEVQIDNNSEMKTQSVSEGVKNIVERAHQQVNIAWTPVSTVRGYVNSKGTLTATFYAGTTYNGIPYGQQINSGKYVPNNVSFDTFLNAVKDSGSVFYTSRGRNGSLNSTYYASDCSAFVSYSYGLPRMTTSTIASSSQFSKVSGNSIYNAQIGDCFNKSGSHVELVTGMHYNSSGTLVSVEISEQTPPKARTVTYTPVQVQNIINTGYTLLRYNGRDGVGTPQSYNGYNSNDDPDPAPPLPSAPSVVSSSKLYGVGSAASVTWNEDSSVSWYDIFVRHNGELVYSENIGKTTTHQISGLQEGEYEVFVTACNLSGNSISEVCSFHVGSPYATNVTVRQAEYKVGDSAIVNWIAGKGAEWYDVFVRYNGELISSENAGNNTSYTIQNVKDGEYEVFVTACNIYGNKISNRCSFRVGGPVAPSVSVERAEYLCGETASITWTSSANAEWYDVFVHYNGELISNDNVGNTTKYQISSLNSGNYEVFVAACNQFGNHISQGCAFQVSGPQAPRVSIQRTNLQVGEVALINWNSDPVIEWYDLYVRHNGQLILGKNIGKITSYQVSDLMPGTYEVFVTACNLCGNAISKGMLFYVSQKDISACQISLSYSQSVFDGTDKEPTVTVKDGDQTLTKGADYEVSYKDNVNVGTATAIVTGKGNYTGTKDVLFSITGKSVANCTVTLSPTSFTYDGAAKYPTVTVNEGNKTLTKGTDYDVSYKDNVNIGTATATVAGKGNYTGSKDVTFSITGKSVDNCTVTLSPTSFTCDGTAKEPSVTVKDGNKTLNKGTDYQVSYKDNVSVGTATVTVTGKGNYTGSKGVTFSITGKSIDNCTVMLFPTSFTYDGTAKEPSVTVKDGNKTLNKGTDYQVSYKDNVSVGTATVTVTGKGNYTGSKDVTFSIAGKSVANCTVTLSSTSFAFDGTAKEPTVTVKDGNKTLTKGTDFEVSYKDNVDVGTAFATVTGKRNYTGSINQTFAITGKNVANCTITLSSTSFTFDRTAKEPAVTVKDGNKTLSKGTDYEVSYKDNVSVGTAVATVTGKGNYTGSASRTFAIAGKSVTNCTVTLFSTSFVYDGTDKTPPVTVKDGDKTLIEDTDYEVSYKDNINVGTATATVIGKGNYADSKDVVFSIVQPESAQVQISSCTIALSETSFSYDGKEKRPAVTVKDGNKTLTKGTDYEVSYKDNVNVGTAFATVNGKGKYTGSASQTVVITGRSVNNFTVTLSPTSFTYDGTAKEPTVTIKDGADTLTNNTDYEVIYRNNVNVGTALVTVTGKGNYAGSTSQTFSITGRSVANCMVTLSSLSFIYDGTAKEPTVIAKDGSKALVEGTDFEVSYSNNTNVGTASVTVSGLGNYTGRKAITFEIISSETEPEPQPTPEKQNNTITAKNVTKTYSTKKQTVKLNAKANGATMTYTSNNKNVTVDKQGKVTIKAKFVGKATITITASETDSYRAATKKVTVTVNPTKTVLSNVKWDKKKKIINVQWKKNTSGKGYEVQYSTDKKFKKGNKTVKIGKSATVKTAIKNLKKGTYYVRIRTVNGKMFSDWSKSQSLKVAK